ncbi:MAG: T9SS type A sorting domain-containing protein [Ignavibacteria bacterium]|nr:T9SS type A sorting domain-containing protein [Ignavibacteria bacterium]
MKIRLFAVYFLLVFSLSLGFGSCSEDPNAVLINFIHYCLSGMWAPGDMGSSNIFTIAVGNNGVILKSDGTDTIHFFHCPSVTTQNLNGLRIQPTTYQPLVIAVGNNGTITRSSDIGETWISSSPITSANLYGVDLNNSYSYAVGDNGTILFGQNGGANWMLVTSGTTRNLKAVSISGIGGGVLVAVGEKGTILRTTDSGLNWSNVSLSDTTVNFYSITQRTRQNFYITNYLIAGSQGKIYKSTDNGVTWILKNSGTTNTLRSIFFSGNDSGAVSGDNGTVRMTTDAGETWFSDPYFNNVTGSITSISLMPRSARTFTAISNNTKLYVASEDTNLVIIGIKNISNAIPDKFILEQNFPNPFNPVTSIVFKVKQNSDVNIVIFDVNGREIETIVNNRFTTGTYSVDWNAANFSSGVYFYQMTAGNFKETRKMILTK